MHNTGSPKFPHQHRIPHMEILHFFLPAPGVILFLVLILAVLFSCDSISSSFPEPKTSSSSSSSLLFAKCMFLSGSWGAPSPSIDITPGASPTSEEFSRTFTRGAKFDSLEHDSIPILVLG